MIATRLGALGKSRMFFGGVRRTRFAFARSPNPPISLTAVGFEELGWRNSDAFVWKKGRNRKGSGERKEGRREVERGEKRSPNAGPTP